MPKIFRTAGFFNHVLMKNIQLYFLSLFSGILLSVPWIFPSMSCVLFFSIFFLLLLVDRLSKSNKPSNASIFAFSFLTFLTWNLLSTWWIAYVSLTGMILISLLTSILMASVWWLAHIIRIRFGLRTGYFALIVFWITLEFLLLHWDVPWPWLTMGNGFAGTIKIIQWYEYTGVLGGSFWILSINCLLYLAFKNGQERKLKNSFKIGFTALLVFLLPLIISFSIYSKYSEDGQKKNVVILQPNIDPYSEKFSGMSPEAQINKLMNLTNGMISQSTDLIISPETALPALWEDSIQPQDKMLCPIFKLIHDYPNVGFISGALTMKKSGDDELLYSGAHQSEKGNYFFEVFNSALFLRQTSGLQISHKSILVNGVEKMPFAKYFSFLNKYLLHLGGANGRLSAAKEPVMFLANDSTQIGPVICFESVFGEFSGALSKRGANMLVVLTNDGWWKSSVGGLQHFNYSRLRAIETRRSIARCANTGISGFINQRGDVLEKTNLNTYEALRSPIVLNGKVTFYSENGDYIGRISAVLSLLVVAYMLISLWYKGNKYFWK